MLKTDRLILRKFKEEDFGDYFEMVSPFAKEIFDENMKFQPLKPHFGNDLNDLIKILNDKRCSFLFKISEIEEARENEKRNFNIILKRENECAVFLPSSQKVIGLISLRPPQYYKPKDFSIESSKEIGVIINKDFQNMGYMTEAVKGIVKYAFSQTQIDAIYARILRGNLASIRLFDKCHFKFLYERNEDTNYNESKKVITKAITKEDLPPEYDDVKYEII